MEIETQTLTLILAPAISELINSLNSSFRSSDISGAERILLSWAQSLKLEVSNSFSDELLFKEVDKIELQVKISHLEKELGFLKEENANLKVSNLTELIEKDELQIKISQLEKKLELVQNENLGLREKVSNLSQIIDETKQELVLEKNDFVIPTPIKKQKKGVVLSDSDTDTNDNATIRNIFDIKEANLASKNVGSRKRRLVRLSKTETPLKDAISLEDEVMETDFPENAFSRKLKSKRKLCFSDSEDESESLSKSRKFINLENSFDSEEEEESDSSESSLSGFIVNGSEPESSNRTQNPSNSSHSSSNSNSNSNFETDLDDDIVLEEVLNKIKRKKKTSNINNNWEYEADMLAEFGKKPETCLKAICALYNRQTEDEQLTKSTYELNQIGFSQIDAERASLIAEFLMGGRAWGQVVRTVQDLERFDFEGVQYCEHIAMKYSKQLFEIYQDNEDPYFGPFSEEI